MSDRLVMKVTTQNSNLTSSSLSNVCNFSSYISNGVSLAQKSGNTVFLNVEATINYVGTYATWELCSISNLSPKSSLVFYSYASDGDLPIIPCLITVTDDGHIKCYNAANMNGKTIRFSIGYVI